jgi:hypothetical protein
MALVFVVPAVAVLLARDILRRYRREREEKREQLRGFEVKTLHRP